MKTKLVILTVLGNIILGLGIAILNVSGFGIDAFTSMTTGISNLLGVGLGDLTKKKKKKPKICSV